jgi:D-cysteine desulfhydrase
VLGVDTGAVDDPERTVRGFVDGLASDPEPSPTQLRIRRDQVGPGYPHLTGPVRDALTTAARAEGLVLDPIYTGRAMAGLIAAAADGSVRPGERTVFLHSGGLPGLFGHPDTVEFAVSLTETSAEARRRP